MDRGNNQPLGDEQDTGRAAAVLRYLPWILVTAGVLLRIGQYLTARSLWVDEAALADSIIQRNFVGLFSPLIHGQQAPPLFLVLVKAVVVGFGPSEYSLRFVPLVCGVLSIPLFFRVTEKLAGRGFATVALVPFILSERLVYYSQELKQYSTDVFVCLLLIFLFLRVVEPPDRPRRRRDLWWLAAVGVICIWLSYPSVFVLGGVVLGFLPALWRKQARTPLLILPPVAWLASFVALYFVQIRPATGDKTLFEYWEKSFLVIPFSLDSWTRDWGILTRFSGYAGFDNLWVFFALVLLAVGVFALWRKCRPACLVVLGALGSTAAASFAGRYPFGDRLGLFLVPLVFLTLAAGARLLAKGRPWFVGVVLALGIMTPFARPAFELLSSRIEREEVKPLLRHYVENREEGDRLYVYALTRSVFNFYKDRFGIEKSEVVYGWSFGRWPEIYRKDVERLSEYPRLWLLFSHVKASDDQFALARLGGVVRDKAVEPGGVLYLVEKGGGREVEIALRNSGFENWTCDGSCEPTGWYVSEPSLTGRDAEECSEGEFSLVMEPGKDYHYLLQTVNLPATAAGKSIVVRAAAKTAARGTGLLKLEIPSAKLNSTGPPHPGNGEWEKIGCRVFLPGDFEGGILRVVIMHNGGGAECRFDDISLVSLE